MSLMNRVAGWSGDRAAFGIDSSALMSGRRACALCGAPHKAHYLERCFILRSTSAFDDHRRRRPVRTPHNVGVVNVGGHPNFRSRRIGSHGYSTQAIAVVAAER